MQSEMSKYIHGNRIPSRKSYSYRLLAFIPELNAKWGHLYQNAGVSPLWICYTCEERGVNFQHVMVIGDPRCRNCRRIKGDGPTHYPRLKMPPLNPNCSEQIRQRRHEDWKILKVEVDAEWKKLQERRKAWDQKEAERKKKEEEERAARRAAEEAAAERERRKERARARANSFRNMFRRRRTDDGSGDGAAGNCATT